MRTMPLMLLALLTACGTRDPVPAITAPPAEARSPAMPGFADEVWVVAESAQVAPGDVRVFLADGTLVMASPNATTALGAWRQEGDQLRVTEDGVEYPADLLSQPGEPLRIRIRGPGDAVEILFRSEGGVLHLTGTVRHLDLEGGVWVISDAAGVNYSPLNLAGEHKVDGRRIEVDARRRNDVMSIGMTGPIIEILRVRQHASPPGNPAPP